MNIFAPYIYIAFITIFQLVYNEINEKLTAYLHYYAQRTGRDESHRETAAEC